MRTERLLGIMGVLAETRHTTIGALAERFEVSTRTISRDLDVLAQAGVPLVTSPGAHGGVHALEGFKVRRDLLSTHDAAALYAALDGLRSVDGNAAVTQLIARLVPNADDRDASDVADPRQPDSPIAIDFSPWFSDGIVQEKLSLLLEAVRERRCIALEYIAREERSRRIVEPAKLIFRQSNWYLHAYCRTREAFRLFKLQRIATIDVLGETFEAREAPPNEFSPLDAPQLLLAEDEAPGTFLVELDYDAVDEFALANAVDARLLYRDEGAKEGVMRFRTDDPAWIRRTTEKLGNLVRLRKP